MNAPIAIFAYRRADHLAAMLTSLRAAAGFAESPVTIFVDGPKSEIDRADVEAVRELVANLRLPNVKAVVRETNIGLKRSIFEGVGALCLQYGRVIVLEDDLIVSPGVLTYFNEALKKYDDERKVWAVSAYMYNVKRFHQRDDAFFLPMAHPWGWATWNRAWSQFNLDEEISEIILKSRSFRTSFDVFGIRDWTSLLSLSLEGQVNSWFIRWNFRVFRSGGLTLFPPQTLIRNLGIAGDGGTHASKLNPYYLLTQDHPLRTHPPILPDSAEIDFTSIDQIAKSWDARVQRLISFLGKIKRRLKRLGSQSAYPQGARTRRGSTCCVIHHGQSG